MRTLFRAADSEWRDLLAGPGVFLFAERAASLWESLADRLAGPERVSQALAEVAREVRVDAIREGHVSQAVPVAERALYRALLGVLREGTSTPSELTAHEASGRWASSVRQTGRSSYNAS